MLAIYFIIGVFAMVYLARAIRIVGQYQKGLVETLGKYSFSADPGLTIIFPPFQSLRLVDMREQVFEVPAQEVITKDNAAVTVDAVVYLQITDPVKAVYNIQSFLLGTTKLAQTTLRNIIGEMSLDQVLTSREATNNKLRLALDEATDKWGVRVGRVEIQRVEPPADIGQAMSKQMKAEREKRAAILEAEGIRQSAILQAEGQKEAAVLKAEGSKQSAILEAEGKSQAITKVADATKYEIETVYGAIHSGRPTNDLIAIKYLEALAKISEGEANKIFLPMETSGILSSLAGISELFKEKNSKKPSGNPA